jgi:hypothetical protein
LMLMLFVFRLIVADQDQANEANTPYHENVE